MNNDAKTQTTNQPLSAKEITRMMIRAAAEKNGGKLATKRGQDSLYDARKFRRF